MTQMWQEIHEQPLVLKTCIENNSSSIKQIVKAIKEHNISYVVIAARGTSDHAAVYAKYIIELQLGIPVSLAAPSVFTVYQKQLKLKDTLVIGISQSGKAADVLEVIRAANQQGAVTLTITNSIESPLAIESRFHLFCSVGLEKSVAATKTFTSQIYLLAQLVAEWSGNECMKNELEGVPEHMVEALRSAEIIEKKAERYRFMNECFVLARGINYSIALEAALKIQETTYIRAKAYASSDFYHGPFAMIEKDMPVIVYAPKGPSLNDMKAMIEKLKEKQAELVVVSNDENLMSLGECAFSIPETDNDIISPFYNVIIAQMFACKLSLVRGINPDSPRSLNKVTITR